MTETNFKIGGVTFAIFALSLLIAGGWANDSCQRTAIAASRDQMFSDDMLTIEASLAYKKPKPKQTRQPQKKRSPKVKAPDTIKLTNNADSKPTKPDKDKPPPPEEFIDPSSVFERNRNINLDEPPAEGDEVSEEDVGSEEGSEWGSSEEAKGDPYVGELVGRITAAWNRPTLDTGKGDVLGCVRLTEGGRIVARELQKRSKNSTLNRSVEEALRKASDMEEPVPPHLISLLTEDGICFRFSPGDD